MVEGVLKQLRKDVYDNKMITATVVKGLLQAYDNLKEAAGLTAAPVEVFNPIMPSKGRIFIRGTRAPFNIEVTGPEFEAWDAAGKPAAEDFLAQFRAGLSPQTPQSIAQTQYKQFLAQKPLVADSAPVPIHWPTIGKTEEAPHQQKKKKGHKK